MKQLIFVVWLAALLVSCGGANSQSELSSIQLPASIEITLNALVPESTPAGEGLLLTVFDEVTGLDYNPQHYEMLSNGEHSYVLTLTVPAGTLLKYRYTRQSAAGNINETGATGQPIPYRLYLVDGPGHVAYDLVAAWADLPGAQETGQVSGTVRNAGNGQALPNVQVVASGQSATTDEQGHFAIAGLAQGLHNLVIYAPDGSYLPFQQGALVAAQGETFADIELTPNLMASVTFLLTPPEDSIAGMPIMFTGSVAQLSAKPRLTNLTDGRYGLTLILPTGADIRYKYTLGDGFWNAEHAANGSFLVRQIIIPTGTTELQIDDQVAAWTAGASAPIWFNLTAPAAEGQVYLQFKLLDWTTTLQMWPLGDGRWAYLLYSPTNFSSALEYRYCLDSACTIVEAAPGLPRSVIGNQADIQQMNDVVESWQGQ